MWYFVDSWLKNEIIFAVFAAAENWRVDNILFVFLHDWKKQINVR